MIKEESYKKFIKDKYDMTLESKFMGINELETLLSIRNDLRFFEIGGVKYEHIWPITYQEFIEWEICCIPRMLRKVKIQ